MTAFMPKEKLKRELIQWAVMITIPAILYITGLHTPIIKNVQGLILMTGIFRPGIDIPPEKREQASYAFRLINQAGERFDFSDFKGKTVFMNFWATWCAPCLAEMPDIQNLYNKLGNEVEFVMISVDHEADRTWKFARNKGFTFPIYRRGSLMPDLYRSQVIPTTFVITPDGKIAVEQHGMAQYDTEAFRAFLIGL